MTKPLVVYLLLCLSAVIIGSYMAVAPAEGRTDHLQAMFSGAKPSLG